MSEVLMENMILDEYTELNNSNCQILTEDSASGNKVYKIKGCFSKAGVKNKNGRVYPIPVMKHAVEEAQKAIADGRFIAECEHPQSAKINIYEIAAKVNQLQMMDDGTVVGEMVILDTPKGKVIKTLVDEGVKLGVSTRGMGSVKKSKMNLGEGVMEDVLEVQPDFALRAIDIVFDPSAGEFGSPDFISEGIEFNKNKTTLKKIWSEAFGY